MSICVFLVINVFYDPPSSRSEHPILSWQWYGQSVFWAQFNILSDSILCQNWNYHPFPFTLSGFNTIQRKYEYFSFLSLISYTQLSVSNWRRERDDLTQSPTFFFFFAPLILPISFGLPAFSLSHWDWQLKIIAFIMCGVFIPSSSVFLFMREQKKKKKMLSAVSLFISSVGRLMRGTVLSKAFCDRLQSPCTGGLVSVRLEFTDAGSHLRSHCDGSLEGLVRDQNYMLQLSKHLLPTLFNLAGSDQIWSARRELIQACFGI